MGFFAVICKKSLQLRSVYDVPESGKAPINACKTTTLAASDQIRAKWFATILNYWYIVGSVLVRIWIVANTHDDSLSELR